MKKIITLSTIIACSILNKTMAQANKNLSNLTAPTAVNVNLLPGTNSIDLGSATKYWNNIYFGGRLFYGKNRVASVDSVLQNTAFGLNTLAVNTTGYYNTAIGAKALAYNSAGYNNIAIGIYSLFGNTSGYDNIAIGNGALYYNTTGYFNSATGAGALHRNTTGYNNTAMGGNALFYNTTGVANTATGGGSLNMNTTGDMNTAIGLGALFFNSTGDHNTAIGNKALYFNETGSENTSIGSHTDVTSGNLRNTTVIGYNVTVNASNKVVIGNSSVTVIGGPVNWSKLSDGRFKNNIQQNVPGLTFINKLKPVTYNLELKKFDKFLGKKDSLINTLKDVYARAEKKMHTGFIAQEVEKAAKELNYDFDGVNALTNDKDNYSIAYADFVPSLVKSVQELSVQNDSLRYELNELKQLVLSIQQKQNNVSAGNSETVPNASISLSNESSLFQNAPNPFNNITVIHYNLPKLYTTATIIVSDKNGKPIKQINISGSGKGSLKIDGSPLAAGTYSYSLVVNGHKIATRQMMILK